MGKRKISELLAGNFGMGEIRASILRRSGNLCSDVALDRHEHHRNVGSWDIDCKILN